MATSEKEKRRMWKLYSRWSNEESLLVTKKKLMPSGGPQEPLNLDEREVTLGNFIQQANKNYKNSLLALLLCTMEEEGSKAIVLWSLNHMNNSNPFMKKEREFHFLGKTVKIMVKSRTHLDLLSHRNYSP